MRWILRSTRLCRKAGVELKAKKGENKEAARLRERLIEAHELPSGTTRQVW